MDIKKVFVIMVKSGNEELCYVTADKEDGIPSINLTPLRSKGFHFTTELMAQVGCNILIENGHNAWVEPFYKAVV